MEATGTGPSPEKRSYDNCAPAGRAPTASWQRTTGIQRSIAERARLKDILAGVKAKIDRCRVVAAKSMNAALIAFARNLKATPMPARKRIGKKYTEQDTKLTMSTAPPAGQASIDPLATHLGNHLWDDDSHELDRENGKTDQNAADHVKQGDIVLPLTRSTQRRW